MFRCQLCGRVAPPRTPAALVVLETRAKSYPVRPQVNSYFRTITVVRQQKP